MISTILIMTSSKVVITIISRLVLQMLSLSIISPVLHLFGTEEIIAMIWILISKRMEALSFMVGLFSSISIGIKCLRNLNSFRLLDSIQMILTLNKRKLSLKLFVMMESLLRMQNYMLFLQRKVWKIL